MSGSKRTVRTMLVGLALVMSGGCRNSSGSLGRAKLSILNLVSVEGEGITWDNRVGATSEAAAEGAEAPARDDVAKAGTP